MKNCVPRLIERRSTGKKTCEKREFLREKKKINQIESDYINGYPQKLTCFAQPLSQLIRTMRV